MGTLFLGMILSLQILAEGYNVISNTYKYMLLAGLVIALLSPKAALPLLLFSAGYIDTLKRFLIFAGKGYVGVFDLTFILAFAPGVALMAYAGCVIRMFIFGERPPKGIYIFFIASTVFMGGMAASIIVTQGTGIQAMRGIANGAGFGALIFVIPYTLRSLNDFMKFLKIVVVMHIPIACYAFYQSIWGFLPFEIAYLEAGLSSEQRILMGEDFRVFSTLNSSQNLGKVMGILSGLVLVSFRTGKIIDNSLGWRLPLAIFFFIAGWTSGSRLGMVMTFMIPGFWWLILRPRFAVTTYLAGFLALLLVILNAKAIEESGVLGEWERGLWTVTGYLGFSQTDNMKRYRTIQLTTLTARLRSYQTLTNPSVWTPFGLKIAKKQQILKSVKVHDIITSYLLRIGYVPLFLLIVLSATIFIRCHKAVWAMPENGIHRRISAFGIAFALTILAGGMTSTNNMETFPVNYYFHLFIGFGGLAYLAYLNRPKEEVEEELSEKPSSAFDRLPPRNWRPPHDRQNPIPVAR
ncbi:MAG: hypothetical protein AAGA58_14215 [Verrucomicrobiota bacterium]